MARKIGAWGKATILAEEPTPKQDRRLVCIHILLRGENMALHGEHRGLAIGMRGPPV